MGRGRKEEVREHPSIPDEEADMSKSNTMTGEGNVFEFMDGVINGLKRSVWGLGCIPRA